MTHSLIDDAALGLLAAINNKVAREIPQVTHKTDIASALKERVVYQSSYFLPKHDAFCVVDAAVGQYGSNKLFFEVYAELNEFDLVESDLYKININEIQLKYLSLKPNTTQGTRHYFKKDGTNKPTAKRIFKVEYTALFESVKKEDGINNYRFDEMSERVFPYIKSLYDIFKIIHPNSKNLKGDNI